MENELLCTLELQKKEIRRQVIERLVLIRKANNLTQTDIAHKLGMQVPNICRFERGDNNITLDMLVKIAGAMDYKVDIQFKPISGDEETSI